MKFGRFDAAGPHALGAGGCCTFVALGAGGAGGRLIFVPTRGRVAPVDAPAEPCGAREHVTCRSSKAPCACGASARGVQA